MLKQGEGQQHRHESYGHTDMAKLRVYRECEKQTKLQHTQQVHVHTYIHTGTLHRGTFIHIFLCLYVRTYVHTHSPKALLLSCFVMSAHYYGTVILWVSLRNSSWAYCVELSSYQSSVCISFSYTKWKCIISQHPCSWSGYTVDSTTSRDAFSQSLYDAPHIC